MSTQMVTCKARIGFANIMNPKVPMGRKDGQPKYSCTVYIPKTETACVEAMMAAKDEAAQNGVATKWGGKMPNPVKVPIYDGDRPDAGPEAKGCWEMRCSSTNKPGVVDENLNPILSPDAVYSGCYGRADVNFYAYNSDGNKGVAIGLNNFQKLGDGERLGGGRSAEEAFGGAAPATQAAPAAAATQSIANATPANPFGG